MRYKRKRLTKTELDNLENLKNDFYRKGGVTEVITPIDYSVRQKFYKSTQWQELRQQFILAHNTGRCVNCTVEWNTIAESNLNVDHKLPIKFYWERRLDITNLQLLCESCNRYKGNVTQYNIDSRMTSAFIFKDGQMKEYADSLILQEKLELYNLNKKQLNRLSQDLSHCANLYKHNDRVKYHKYAILREESVKIAQSR